MSIPDFGNTLVEMPLNRLIQEAAERLGVQKLDEFALSLPDDILFDDWAYQNALVKHLQDSTVLEASV